MTTNPPTEPTGEKWRQEYQNRWFVKNGEMSVETYMELEDFISTTIASSVQEAKAGLIQEIEELKWKRAVAYPPRPKKRYFQALDDVLALIRTQGGHMTDETVREINYTLKRLLNEWNVSGEQADKLIFELMKYNEYLLAEALTQARAASYEEGVRACIQAVDEMRGSNAYLHGNVGELSIARDVLLDVRHTLTALKDQGEVDALTSKEDHAT